MSIINCSQINRFQSDKPLYKFLKKEHLDCLFIKGLLRIGTLFNFRDQENYGVHRGDSGEGKKEIFEFIENETIQDPSIKTLSPFAQQFIRLEDTATNTQLSNITFTQAHDSMNYFIYCLSKSFDKTLYDKFETNVCIRIRSPYKFVSYISKSLNKHANFVGLSSVIYGERKQIYGQHDQYHAAIIKTNEYKYQKEVRALWEPKNKTIQPPSIDVLLPVKCVKRYCEIFDEL